MYSQHLLKKLRVWHIDNNNNNNNNNGFIVEFIEMALPHNLQYKIMCTILYYI